MSHVTDRTVHDADSHLIETRGWLESYASRDVAERFLPGVISLDLPILDPLMAQAESRLAGDDPELTQALKDNLFGHKGKLNQWLAYGATDKAERSESLDLMGVASQLVFPTLAASRFSRHEDLDVVYGGCDALNRAMADFCSDDPRLLPVGYLSHRDPERAVTSLQMALDLGIRTVWIASDAVEGRAPSHVCYDPIWAMLEEARVPVTLHIGSGQNMPSAYMNVDGPNDAKPNPSNLETTRPKDLPVVHHSIERWLTCMIYDGVLERHPNLKVGLVELGANWLPASLMNLDMGVSLLGKFDEKLKALSIKPSEYVQRQVRVAPLHTEDTGWILRNVGKDILMFNTDYPHPEGGRDPFGDFERSLDNVAATEEELDRFYTKNYEDYLGINAV